jgi:hypothetical protein
MNRLGPAHPRLGANAADPIGETWDASEVLNHMLLTDEPDGNDATRRERQSCPEQAFQHEDSFGMMPAGAMPEISDEHFGFVHPVMEWQIFFGFAAPFFRG